LQVLIFNCGGSSVAAVKDRRLLDASLGYSPLPGLAMPTRCGYSADEASEILNEVMKQHNHLYS